ncbi:MAG: Glyoxalase/bleomycin resistance/dioxygenase family protein [Sphingomonas bacterium]|uniref:VOC family protein n=1 Tax=Sphingomonas bacterium TaxID=1895847 RepID=UPI00263553BA|nr:VOC family protein [Sphingomonas bacterium]MDB5702887.1 Glyoxalase/bleomycin resistance/dioxygenase family protein [Sphingomonas bacterium]
MIGNALRTNHVGFTVDDLDRPIAMFAELFGYTLTSRGGRNARGVARLTGVADADILVAHLHHPDLIGIELIAYHRPEDRGRIGGRPCDTGYTHLTFDVRDIEALVAEAAAHGLVPVGEIVGRRGAGARVVYLRDPDGINIELIEPGDAAP